MAQLAVSIAGAAIGSMFGPLGMQIGWAAGSLIGGMLFAEGQQGPRLSDLKVQVSSYGAALPLPYGGIRLAGNVIWASDLQEHASESSGKGGPSVTNYSYSVSCAVAIADRPIGGIRRIWADAKLVYDAREDATAEAQAASTMFAEYMTVYLGSETQLPDPTIEAAEGAGNVEAYRGVAYVVFTDLPLGDYGNRVPNFSFEVTNADPDDLAVTKREPLVIFPWKVTPEGRPIHSVGDTLYTTTSLPITSSTDFGVQAALNAANYDGQSSFPVGGAGADWVGLYRNDLTVDAYNLDGDHLAIDPENVYYHLGVGPEGVWDIDDRTWPGDIASSLGFSLGPRYLEIFGVSRLQPMVVQRVESATPPVPTTPWPFVNNMASGYYGGVYTYTGGYPLAALGASRVPTHRARDCEPGNPCALGIAELPSNENFCITCSGDVSINYQWHTATGTAKQLCAIEYRSNSLYQNALGPVLLPSDPNYNNAAFWAAERAAAMLAGLMAADVSYPVVVTSWAEADPPPVAAVEAGSMLLSDIVSDICLRAGLQAGDINVTQLIDEVQGFAVTRQMTARAALTPLLQAYYVDAVDTGDKILFVKRGGSVVDTIGPDDLGATESGDAEPLVIPKRAQETELPAAVDVAYLARDADYQTGTQQARRVVVGSQQVTGVELPIVLTDDRAAEVADVIMVDAWQGRVERKFSTTRRWTHLLPTDVITLDDGQFLYRGRLTEKIEDGPVIRWTMRDDSAATYSPSVTASVTNGGGGSVTLDGPMVVELMDLPALRDADDNAGFYAAAYSYIGRFRGGTLFVSQDDAAFDALQEMRVSATVGHAITVLAAHAGGNTFDEANTVTVTLHSGSLASVTRSQVLNGANCILIGDEVLQFRTATLTAPDTYVLSGLLRGRRGTEWAMAGHTASDRFVLLDESNVYRVARSLPQIGTAYYRAVANGQAVVNAPSENFTNTGAALRPLSPVHLTATPSGGNLVLNWTRRTRIGGSWMDGIDVPLSEAVESYRVRVLDADGAVLEEQAVGTTTATVTNDSAAATIEVAQMSATVGAGFPATLTL